MNWADTLKATSLATLAGRKTTADRIFASTSSSWNQNDPWLTRAKQTRDGASRSPVRDPATPMRHLAAWND